MFINFTENPGILLRRLGMIVCFTKPITITILGEELALYDSDNLFASIHGDAQIQAFQLNIQREKTEESIFSTSVKIAPESNVMMTADGKPNLKAFVDVDILGESKPGKNILFSNYRNVRLKYPEFVTRTGKEFYDFMGYATRLTSDVMGSSKLPQAYSVAANLYEVRDASSQKGSVWVNEEGKKLQYIPHGIDTEENEAPVAINAIATSRPPLRLVTIDGRPLLGD